MKKLSMNKKGFMDGPAGYMITGILGLFVVSLLLYALALTSATMRTQALAYNDSNSISVIGNTSAGVLSFAAFTPVLWIIVGVTGLIGFIVGGIIVYFVAKRN